MSEFTDALADALTKAGGVGEAGLSLLTAPAGFLGGLAGGANAMVKKGLYSLTGTPQPAELAQPGSVDKAFDQGAAALTYQPRGAAGQDYADTAGSWLQQNAPAAAGFGPEVAMLGKLMKPSAQYMSAAASRMAQAVADNAELRSPSPGSRAAQLGAIDMGGKPPPRDVQAPKVVDVEDRYQSGDAKGTYRGTSAFGGITPGQLASMRTKYLQKMEQGVDARHWYDDSSADISRWVGGDTAEADKMANILATTSSSTPVASNLMYANKGWNQLLVGDDLNTGKYPAAMAEAISKAIENPESAELGLKRSPFSAGLSVDWRGSDFANRATHDIHDARAWGITDPQTGDLWSKGIPDAGHRFLDAQADVVTNRANATNLGGASDWTPYRAQAAAWVAQKAANEGVPIETAARHYGSFAPEYQGMIAREHAPGPNTGHLPELQGASPEAQRAFSDDMEAAVTGDLGIDNVARRSGALVDRTHENVGYYEGQTNPGYSSLINVGKGLGSQEMDAASAKVLDAIASAHGILSAQKQVAHNYAGGPVAIKDSGVTRLAGPYLDDAHMQALMKDLTGIGADVPMRDPAGGARVLNFGDTSTPAAVAALGKARNLLAKRMKEVADYHGLEVEHRAQSGNLIPFDAPDKWTTKPFLEAIDASGPMAEKVSAAMQAHAGPMLDVVNAHAAKNGWTQAPWYRPMMEGLRDGGIPRLKELVKKGIVPVAAFTAVGGLLAPGQPQGMPD